MPLVFEIHATRADAERVVAEEIAALVRAKPTAVLGLATGDTPTGVYRELVRLRRETGLDFARVRTFNLDEYCALAADDAHSFRSWMNAQLFGHVNLAPAHTHLPDGTVADAELERHCRAYEQAIEDAGGIDLQLLGIGRNGHIGFNEPGADVYTRTRRVELHAWTRADAAHAFGGIERVPTAGITMGVATILAARCVRVLAFGARKAPLVARTLATEPDSAWPASFVRLHADARLVVDRAAAR